MFARDSRFGRGGGEDSKKKSPDAKWWMCSTFTSLQPSSSFPMWSWEIGYSETYDEVLVDAFQWLKLQPTAGEGFLVVAFNQPGQEEGEPVWRELDIAVQMARAGEWEVFAEAWMLGKASERRGPGGPRLLLG